jgi:hypothetical protein
MLFMILLLILTKRIAVMRIVIITFHYPAAFNIYLVMLPFLQLAVFIFFEYGAEFLFIAQVALTDAIFFDVQHLSDHRTLPECLRERPLLVDGSLREQI